MFRQGGVRSSSKFHKAKAWRIQICTFVTRLMLFFELISVTAFIGIFRYMVVFYYKNVE